MKKDHVESLEEILFKDRNKQYGAYAIRKKYNSHVIVSLFIAVLFAGSALTYPIINRKFPDPPPIKDSVTIVVDHFQPRIEKPPIPDVPPPPQRHDAIPKPIVFTTPVVTDNPTDPEYGKPDPESVTGNPPPDNYGGNVEPVEKPSEPVIAVPELPAPKTIVTQMPQFPGGDQELKRYLLREIHYPKDAREALIQGVVFLSFVIETDGSVSSIKILRGIGGGCEAEAIRVVSQMPKWKAGSENGIPTRVVLNLPVKFTLCN